MRNSVLNIILVILFILLVLALMWVFMKRNTEGFEVSPSGFSRLSNDSMKSFVSDVPYVGNEYISDSDWINKCAKKCKSDTNCKGFFEQTHLCPQPKNNDKVSNPNQTPGKGCYRICGFYNQGKGPSEGTLGNGPRGSVWKKK